MKFLLDESVEFRLSSWLAGKGHDVTAIAHDYPHTLSDREVVEIARREGRVLITSDRDFGELIFRQKLSHAGVIFFRMGAATLDAKIARLRTLFATHPEHLRSFVVVSERSIRVR